MANGAGFFLFAIVEGLKAMVVVNGFPVYYSTETDAARVTQKIAHDMKSGSNEIEVFLQLPASVDHDITGEPVFQLILTKGAAPVPADGTPILHHAWHAKTQPLAADGGQTLVLNKTFEIPELLGPWAWEKCVSTDAAPEHEAAVYRFVSDLAVQMRTGSPEAVLPFLSLRNREIASSLGLSEDHMTGGFSQFFVEMAAAPDFSVDLPDSGDIQFRWEKRGRWVVPFRKNGDAALQITSDGTQQPYLIVVGWLEGSWTIIR